MTAPRPAESIAQLEVGVVHGADFPMPYNNLSRAHVFLGNLDEAERWYREEYIPRLGFEAATREEWDRAAAGRFRSLRSRNLEAYERGRGGRGQPGDYLLLGDTLRAIDALGDRYMDLPRFNASVLNGLWTPDLDGIRDDRRFRGVFDEILAHAGLEGAVLKRAPAGE